MSKLNYTERETRIAVAWSMLTFGVTWIAFWAIQNSNMPRPPYIIDLALPMLLMAVGAYLLKKKIPEK